MKELMVISYKHGNCLTKVDDEDFEYLKKFSVYLCNSGKNNYCSIMVNGKSMYLHRYILQKNGQNISGKVVDHKDHNTLNNQKSNLRLCGHSQNGANQNKHKDAITSKYKGVSFFPKSSKWKSVIIVGRKHKHIGYFNNEIDAAIAYDIYANHYFGSFAYLNFPHASEADKTRVINIISTPLKNPNLSGYRGVSRSGNKWRFNVECDCICIRKYGFNTAIEAAMARDAYIIDNKLDAQLSLRNVILF